MELQGQITIQLDQRIKVYVIGMLTELSDTKAYHFLEKTHGYRSVSGGYLAISKRLCIVGLQR